MNIPFTKAHGALNDFLLSWDAGLPTDDRAALAVAICHRHAGIGADGWIVVSGPEDGADGSIQVWNSDGSTPEISGNGTRCAAAFLIDAGHASGDLKIRTGAGVKHLRLLGRHRQHFEFEMNMGQPRWPYESPVRLELRTGAREGIVVDVGNPQCAFPVEDFEFDWRAVGAETESHPFFPNRTNVSFVRRVDRHTLEARFYERGAGETMSSGTGSTGAVAAAVRMGWVEGAVTVATPAGDLEFRVADSYYLTGPAQILGHGEFFWEP